MIFTYLHIEPLPGFASSIWVRLFGALKISPILSYIFFFVGLFLTTFLVFIQHDFYKHQLFYNPWSKFPNMLFNAFSRAGFVFGLTLIILPTFVGKLSWVKSLLSSDFMCVAGRLTFAVYLMHIPWINVFLADSRQGAWVNNLNQWWLCFAVTVISFLFAIPYSLICVSSLFQFLLAYLGSQLFS